MARGWCPPARSVRNRDFVPPYCLAGIGELAPTTMPRRTRRKDLMDVISLLSTSLRRWYVVVPVITIAVISAFALAERAEVTYASAGTVIFVGPSSVPAENFEQVDVNPYLSFTGSLNSTASAVRLVMDGPDHRSAVAAQGLVGTYLITQENSTLTFNVTGSTEKEVTDTLDGLIAQSGEELDRLQSTVAAPDDQLVRLDVLSQPTRAAISSDSGKRLFLATLGLGLVAAVTLASALEAWAVRRTREPGDAVDLEIRTISGPEERDSATRVSEPRGARLG